MAPAGRRKTLLILVMVRNAFLILGTLLTLAGVGLTLFDPPSLYWNSRMASTPDFLVLIALSKPFSLILGGLGMMLGSIAAAIGCLSIINFATQANPTVNQ
ncbi:hypothetical protein GCM10009525_39050 [Streptosporangium amethystogenes subsp. fukuiense]